MALYYTSEKYPIKGFEIQLKKKTSEKNKHFKFEIYLRLRGFIQPNN